MGRPHLEVADIVRRHEADLRAARNGRISAAERKVLHHLAACRTSACGGHVQRCDACQHLKIAYNSCRNRHCPKCQELARAQWVEDRRQELLPVPYFHLVFSIPHELSSLALQNKKVVYGILFRAATQTLQEIARDPKHLGAEIGCLAVLHTWGQTLSVHPHIHCVVPGGGLSPDRRRWVACRRGFFLPVRVLGSLFRGKFLHALQEAFRAGQLAFHGSISHLRDVDAFYRFLGPLYKKKWVVYSKAPFGGPEQVYKYLARYTHRVAIANSRLVSLHDGKVTFTWKDYAHGSRQRIMVLGAVDFLGRFLRHLLPKGFQRIRHAGFLANRCRKKNLALCRQLLRVEPPALRDDTDVTPREAATRCPQCKVGVLVCILVFRPGEPLPHGFGGYDTS